MFFSEDGEKKTMEKLAEFEFGGEALVIYRGRCGGNKSIRVWAWFVPQALCVYDTRFLRHQLDKVGYTVFDYSTSIYGMHCCMRASGLYHQTNVT